MKIAVPFLLIVLLACSGCGKKEVFDIRGAWSFGADGQELYAFSFEGSLENGTLTEARSGNLTGTYTVADKEVAFDFISTMTGGPSGRFQGVFTAETQMSGNLTITAPYPPFTWTVPVEGRKR